MLLAINCIDLTTLSGDDTASNISRLCWRATNPLCGSIVDKLIQLGHSPVTTGAVCGKPFGYVRSSLSLNLNLYTCTFTVYPLRVKDCKYYLNVFKSPVPIASVVANFPAGQGIGSNILAEIKYATECGANEIDIVINRTLVLTGQWLELYEEIRQVALLCNQLNVHLKVILSYGELASLDNVYKVTVIWIVEL